MNKKILILTIIPLALASCVVSKRKYEELDYAKRKSDAQVRKLNKDNSDLDTKLKQTLAEYNEMKNSMAESNAQKNVEIDQLSTELFSMASDTTSLKEKLHETLGNYKFAQERNAENEAIISKLKEQIKNLKAESYRLTKELDISLKDKEMESQKADGEKLKLKEKLAQKDNQIAKVKKEMEVVNGKIAWLRKVKKQNDAEIERLTNQMNLYKKEYEKAISVK
ncbi:hypothetical protein EV201_0269 [Ancylomarina subtilis]|uniref:Uncharacterized protein n=1 Tax=Ancylomarina subtilis TaxID=1639035 RepID=A0A4V6MEJ2_9BACT|nr:hypothetical protein [Ancylomarina subtilis]RZT95645.1 hypothetical protein EV201_0269 [Ancylomarina subtilis]